MANVVRFTLPTAQDLTISGAGSFVDGVLDVDVNNVHLLNRTRYLVRPFGAIELGIVDEDTPPPLLPAVPLPPSPDPYPQYVTDSDLTTPLTGAVATAIRSDSGTYTGNRVWTGFHDFEIEPTVDGVPIGGAVADATTTTKGAIQLAGDLAGTADAPTVPGLTDKIATTQKGVANGVASLGSDGKVPTAQLPSISISDFLGVTASQAAMLSLLGQRGDWATRTDLGADFILIADDPTVIGSWRQITSPGGVTSVAGRNGSVVLVANDISDATATGKSILQAANAAAVRAASNAASLVHSHAVTDIAATGTLDDTTVLHGDGVWRPPAGGGGGGGTFVYNTVKWDSTTSTWPTRPAVPISVPVFWMSVRYPTAGAPPGALADDIWYPNTSELP